MSKVEYTRVLLNVKRQHERSIIVEHPDTGVDVIVGKSCIAYVDLKSIEAADLPQEFDVRIMSWLVDKEGLV